MTGIRQINLEVEMLCNLIKIKVVPSLYIVFREEVFFEVKFKFNGHLLGEKSACNWMKIIQYNLGHFNCHNRDIALWGQRGDFSCWMSPLTQ